MKKRKAGLTATTIVEFNEVLSAISHLIDLSQEELLLVYSSVIKVIGCGECKGERVVDLPYGLRLSSPKRNAIAVAWTAYCANKMEFSSDVLGLEKKVATAITLDRASVYSEQIWSSIRESVDWNFPITMQVMDKVELNEQAITELQTIDAVVYIVENMKIK